MAVLVRAERRTPTEKTLGWLLAVAAAEFGVLAVTGVFLVFFYRPPSAIAWGDRGLRPSSAVTFVEVVRFVHRHTAHLMVPTVLALAVVAIVLALTRSLRARPRRVMAVAAVGIALVTIVGSFTGYLLPWDQLALWSVTVGTSMMGFLPIIRHSSQVQAVLIGGSQISVDTLRRWFFIHVLLVPAVLLVLGLVATQRFRSRRDEPDRHTGLGS